MNLIIWSSLVFVLTLRLLSKITYSYEIKIMFSLHDCDCGLVAQCPVHQQSRYREGWISIV